MSDVLEQAASDIQFGTPYSLDRHKGVGAWPRSEFLLRAGYKVDVLTKAEDIRQIVPQWRELLTESGSPSLFQSADWCMAIVDAVTYLDRQDIEMRVVTVYSGDRLVCLLPLMVESRLGLRQARILGEPISQYSEILVAPGFPGVVDRAIAGFIEQEPVDVIRLRRVREGGALDQAMVQWHALVTDTNKAPFIDMKATNKKRQLLNLRKRMHKQVQNGVLTVECLTGTDCAAHSQAAIAMKMQWLNDNKLISRAFADPVWRDALTRTMSGHSPVLTPVMTVVSINGREAAYNVSFRLGDVLAGFLLAYRQEFKSLSPGNAGTAAQFDWATGHQISVLDMLAPDSPYKQNLASGCVVVRDYSIPLTSKGHVYTQVVDGQVRRLLKANLNRIPAPLRKLVARFS